MAGRISKLSIEQIRERYGRADQPVTPQLLSKLKRDPRRGVRQLYQALEKRYRRERAARQRLDAMLNFERVLWRSGVRSIAGVDEAGTGPLAGPVVAAAVVFPPHTELDGIDDSKRLDAPAREAAEAAIRRVASGIGVGVAEVEEIDRVNIYQAALLAMRRAVEALPTEPEHLLVDARVIPGVAVPQNSFNKGDGIDFSIAAASIIAKTHRDRLMNRLAEAYPQYGFERHKGYGTPEHQDAIRRFGPCAIHRKSFTFIRELCGEYSSSFYELKARVDGTRCRESLQVLEQEVAACEALLDDDEQRKLRLMLSRRWKSL